MYLRESKQRRVDGSVVTYLQLAENVWDPEKRRSQASIVWNCGRADDGEVVETLAQTGQEPCRGLSALKGFMSWVKANVPADQHEHYSIMQKALFVSRVQKVDMESLLGKSAGLSGPPEESCYGTQPELFQAALRVSLPRRLSRETAGKVLEFF